MEDSLAILSLLYGVMTLIYSSLILRDIMRTNEIRIIHGFKGMYSFVYGFLPCFFYWKEGRGEYNLLNYYYSGSEIFNLYLFFVASVMGFIIISIAYKYTYGKKTYFNEKNNFDGVRLANASLHGDTHVLRCGIIALFVGWTALFLWTRAYGSIHNFIMNASLIRSGLGSVNNSWAFMKHFTGLIQISLYAFVAAYMIRKPKWIRWICYMFLISIALYGCYIYLLTSDSRHSIALTGIAVIILLLRHRHNRNIFPYIMGGAIAACLLLFAVIFADSFTHYVRHGSWVSQDISFGDSLIREFSFIPNAQFYVMQALSEGNLHLKFIDDVINASVSWVPERFIPFSLPPTVWTENTLNLHGGNVHGTQPTDLLSTGVYHFGYLGFLITPIIFGILIGWIDRKMKQYKNVYYTDPYYAFLMSLCLLQVSHFELSSITLRAFPLFFYFIISQFMRIRI